MLVSRKDKIHKLFIFLACAVVLSALYHLYGIFDPDLREGYPWQRHLFWVVADAVGIYFLLNRRWYLIPVLAVVLVQQLQGHGSVLISIWLEQARVSYIDLYPVILVALIFCAYSYDIYKSRTGGY